MFKSSKLASCKNLKLWQKSVTNMIWWSIGTSIGKLLYFNYWSLVCYFKTADTIVLRKFWASKGKDPVYISALCQYSYLCSILPVSSVSTRSNHWITPMDRTRWGNMPYILLGFGFVRSVPKYLSEWQLLIRYLKGYSLQRFIRDGEIERGSARSTSTKFKGFGAHDRYELYNNYDCYFYIVF